MSHNVHLTEHAKSLLNDYASYIERESGYPQIAAQWLADIGREMASLATFPEAYALARENDSHALELRQKVHGNYRIIFYIDGLRVNIVSVRHVSRLPHKSCELDSIT